MTGAAPIHALAPEVHLRPLLVELGASTPSRGLFVTEQQLDDLDTVIASWARVARPLVDRSSPRAFVGLERRQMTGLGLSMRRRLKNSKIDKPTLAKSKILVDSASPLIRRGNVQKGLMTLLEYR